MIFSETQVQTLMSNPYNIAEAVRESDLVIGAVLIPGAKAPKLVTEEMIQSMKPGSVVVDIAIDQGGYFRNNLTVLQLMITQLMKNMALFIMQLRICQVRFHVHQLLH